MSKEPWLKTECVALGDTHDNDIVRVTRKDGSVYFHGTRKDGIDFIVKQGMARKLDPLRCKEHDPGESGTYDWVRATVHLDDCRVRLDYRCSHLDIDGSHAALTKLGNALKAAFDK